MEELKYPIGRFQAPAAFTAEMLQDYIQVTGQFPQKLEQEVIHLNDEQLDTPYRPEGWSIRQVVNHCADSHMNALIRVKLALTEDKPTVKPYLEALWADLPDGKMPIQPALLILKGIHERWTTVLNGMQEKDWERSFFHPEKGRSLSLKEASGSYAWHCEHHLAHIVNLKKRMGWK